jgi:hypothetical protein
MKITYSKDITKLSTRLKEVLDIVYAKRPLLEYEVIEAIKDEATRVVVYQDGQKIGRLDAHRRRYSPSKGMNEIWFGIESHTIKKQRGAENTKYCKDAKTAARIAIESFTKKSLADLGVKLIDETIGGVTSIVERLQYQYASTLNYSSSEISTYFLDVIAGKNPPIPQKIHDQIISKDLARIKDNRDIGENILRHMKNKNGYCIRTMQDESLLFAHLGNPSTTSKHGSTYELDQYTQEKYTMLKLLDANQCAADIGVKFESSFDGETTMVYFIVAGETVTH